MGAMQRAKEADLSKRQIKRNSNPYGSPTIDNSDTAWDIADCSEGVVAGAISAVLRAGDLISFSRARAGYAVNVSILSGDERYKFWCADINELERQLSKIELTAREAIASNPPK